MKKSLISIPINKWPKHIIISDGESFYKWKLFSSEVILMKKIPGQTTHSLIRFGDLPKEGRSRNHLTGELEPGISVYKSFTLKGSNKVIPILPSFDPSVLVSLCGSITGIQLNQIKCYKATGAILLGRTGSDGEPLLVDCELGDEVEFICHYSK